ncbi:MAG: SMP-30/gluconolactonase/LRE family protein [Bryobacterales bacterium]|nr:SMP-30/gluconolactonase/LRE family protein [Bryobacterales bacterium]
MAHPAPAQPSFRTSEFRELASGLNYPEGPLYRPDGSVLVAEVGGGTVTRVRPDGVKELYATLGGGPNGLAAGPDGAIYVCNDGGFSFLNLPGLKVALGQPESYVGGSIQRIAPNGAVTTLYTHFDAKHPVTGATVSLPLRSPDDLVFDSHGGFYFTDWGKDRWRDRDITGVYYAQPDGSSIQELIFPLQSPNGIALSPCESRLYVTESWTRKILYWELDGPGQIRPNPPRLDNSHLLSAAMPYQAGLDSMNVDETGNVYVAALLPNGADPTARGGIIVVSPDGKVLEWIPIDIGPADPLPSNITFGGPDRRTAYITLGGTGRLISCQMRIPGKKPAFE